MARHEMTRVFFTIDTEYSSGLVRDLSDADREDNFARSIACITQDEPAGITHKLKLFAQHDIRAVFFVDPMPALIWGVAAIEDVVAPILEAGQDVQLHCHTEWLEIANSRSAKVALDLSQRTGRNLFDFPYDDQCQILEYARDTLVAAGAPSPVAFRAGNYGANDETLQALSGLGIQYDSSHCPGIANGASRISLTPNDRIPIEHMGVVEVPIGSIGAVGDSQRHAQVTSLTLPEMLAAIRHARDTCRPNFTLVTHSFELINRHKHAVNRIVRHRFEKLCHALETMEGVTTGNYIDTPPVAVSERQPAPILPPSILRTTQRYVEQLVSNTVYGA